MSRLKDKNGMIGTKDVELPDRMRKDQGRGKEIEIETVVNS